MELESEDVQRSAIVGKILDIYGGASSSKPGPTGPNAIVAKPPVKEVKKTIIDGSNSFERSSPELVRIPPSSSPKYFSNDAALIPLQHMSKRSRK